MVTYSVFFNVCLSGTEAGATWSLIWIELSESSPAWANWTILVSMMNSSTFGFSSEIPVSEPVVVEDKTGGGGGGGSKAFSPSLFICEGGK